MSEVTHEEARLLLELYDLRREARLREACAWLLNEFQAETLEELQRLCPPGSREDASFRMATTYWDMCAALVNRGLIDEDLYFSCVREQWAVWTLLEPLIPEIRNMMKDPLFYSELEEHARRYEAWAEARRSPETAEGVRDFWAARRQVIAASRETS